MKFIAKLQPAFMSLLVFFQSATLHSKDENNSEKSIFSKNEMLIPENLLDASGNFFSSEFLKQKYIDIGLNTYPKNLGEANRYMSNILLSLNFFLI